MGHGGGGDRTGRLIIGRGLAQPQPVGLCAIGSLRSSSRGS